MGCFVPLEDAAHQRHLDAAACYPLLSADVRTSDDVIAFEGRLFRVVDFGADRQRDRIPGPGHWHHAWQACLQPRHEHDDATGGVCEGRVPRGAESLSAEVRRDTCTYMHTMLFRGYLERTKWAVLLYCTPGSVLSPPSLSLSVSGLPSSVMECMLTCG